MDGVEKQEGCDSQGRSSRLIQRGTNSSGAQGGWRQNRSGETHGAGSLLLCPSGLSALGTERDFGPPCSAVRLLWPHTRCTHSLPSITAHIQKSFSLALPTFHGPWLEAVRGCLHAQERGGVTQHRDGAVPKQDLSPPENERLWSSRLLVRSGSLVGNRSSRRRLHQQRGSGPAVIHGQAAGICRSGENRRAQTPLGNNAPGPESSHREHQGHRCRSSSSHQAAHIQQRGGGNSSTAQPPQPDLAESWAPCTMI